MRYPIIPLLCVAALLPASAQDGAKSAAAAPAVKLVIDLSDGSRVIGAPVVDRFKIATQFAGAELAWSRLLTVEFGGADHVAKVNLQNGDLLHGKLAVREITVKTAFGEVTIPVARVSKILVGGDFVNSLGMEFIAVPGVKVLFSIWDTRVRDYRAYAEAYPGVDGKWKDPEFEQKENEPVVNVDWQDAKTFCEWLTDKERKEGKIQKDQAYRLPTDKEWSMAAGLPKETGKTPKEKSKKIKGTYPWGKQWPPPKGAGNYDPLLKVDNYEHTSPVGSFAANRLGVYDMGGNVWQWCEDWYVEGDERVIRGSSWNFYQPGLLLSSYRNSGTLDLRVNFLGFRCVLGLVRSR